MKINEIVHGSWLYHATSLQRLLGIARRGLRPGNSRRNTFHGYDSWTHGSTFFATTPEAALKWFNSVHGQLNFKYHDDEQRTTIMIRVPANVVSNIEDDILGNDDIQNSVKTNGSVIPARLVQFWQPQQGWLPLNVKNIYNIEIEARRGHVPPLEAFDQ